MLPRTFMATSFSSARLRLMSSSLCGEKISVFLSDNKCLGSELTASSSWSPTLPQWLLTSSPSLSKKRESSSNRLSPPNVLCNLKSYKGVKWVLYYSRLVYRMWYRTSLLTYSFKFQVVTKCAKTTCKTNTCSPAFPSKCGLTVTRWSDLSSASSPSCSWLPSLSQSNPSHELALAPEIWSA